MRLQIPLLRMICALAAAFAPVYGAHGALVPVLGGQAYYDDVIGITWMTDADPFNTGAAPNLGWDGAVSWAASLSIGGVTGWRLPSVDRNGDGTIFDCAAAATTEAQCMDNEFGYLSEYYGINYATPAPFTGVVGAPGYWTSTDLVGNSAAAHTFQMALSGVVSGNPKDVAHKVWAVRSGNAGAVPVPAAVWLFGSGLIGLLGIVRRRKA